MISIPPGSAHLEGIDFAGKTGTAQQMSHEALEKTNKGKATYPNVWFVGVMPRRNPELVVAVLWQNGEFSYYPARIGAQVVAAYVDKKRRLANNLPPEKAARTAGGSGRGVDRARLEPAGRRRRQARGSRAGISMSMATAIVAANATACRKARARSAVADCRRQASSNSAGIAAQLAARACPRGGKEPHSPMRRILSFRDFDWGLLGAGAGAVHHFGARGSLDHACTRVCEL